MRRAKIILTVLLAAACLFSLFLINKDLFHYEYTYPYSRTFTPEENTKGKYPVTEAVPLKKGRYEIRFSGFSEGSGSGCYVLGNGDEEIFSSDISAGEITDTYILDLASNTPVRIGFSYDPKGGQLEVRRITLRGDHVLYRESLFRHALFSLLAAAVFLYLGIRLLKPGFPEAVLQNTGLDLPVCERIFLFLLVLTLLASWPLFDVTRFTEGDDFYFHISRIEGMAQTMKAGYFPPRILLGWMENYGVGCGFYYPDLLMLVPAVLCMLGMTAIDSLRIFLVLCTFFSLLSVYLSAGSISSGRQIPGIIAASLYAFAAYRLLCVFYRNAIGEVQAFIFLPLILSGFIGILQGSYGKWKIFALGFFGLLMSHMISLAIAGLLCAVCLLFFIPDMLRDKKIPAAFAKAAAAVILLGAFFLLPMAEQAMKNELEINVFAERPFVVRQHNLMPFSSIFLPFDPWDHEHVNAHAYPGYALLLVPVLRLILLLRKKRDPLMKTADRIMIAGVLLMIVSTDLFPWQIFKWLLARIQFSWRFYGSAAVLLCTAGGLYYDMLTGSVKRKEAAVLIMIAASLLSGFPILIHTFSAKLYPLDRLNTGNKIISGVEYIPPDFDYLHLDKNRSRVQTDETRTRVFDSRRQKLGFVFSFTREAEGDPLDYSLPLIYYYGYTAFLTAEDGTGRKIPVSRDETGLVSVNDEGTRTGTIRVSYEKTAVQKIGETVSCCTLPALLFFEFRNKRRKQGRIR